MDALPNVQDSPLYHSNGSHQSYSDNIADVLHVRTLRHKKGKGKGGAKAKGGAKTKRSGVGNGVDGPGLQLTADLSPVMHMASPYMMTPGPPSFSIVGLLRDYCPAFFRVGSDAS